MDSAVLYAIGQIGICIQQLFMLLFTIPIGDLPINMGELLLFGIALKISISLFFTSYNIKGAKSSKVKQQAKKQSQNDGKEYVRTTSNGTTVKDRGPAKVGFGGPTHNSLGDKGDITL